MTNIADVVSNLIGQTAFMNLTVGNLIMILVAFIFLFLAIKMGFEPLLLVPIAFGMLLVISIRILWPVRRRPLTAWPDFSISSISWMNGVFFRP